MVQPHIDWTKNINTLAEAVEVYKRRLLEAVYRLAVQWATAIANDAKAAAPWTDRTGAARAGLFGRAVRMAMGAMIVVGHSVFYGIFLERRWAGKYAAIIPAMQRAYAPIQASMQALIA